MSAVPTTFNCPHCGAQYPVKPVLVGKVVRCTTCKNPFRLRPDGIADKVEAAPAAPASAPVAPAPAAAAPAKPVVAVLPPAAAAPAKPATSPATAATQPAKPVTSAPAAAPAPTPAKPPSSSDEAPVTSRIRPPTPKPPMTRVVTKQQEEMRRAMADSLKAVADEALKAEEAADQQAANRPGSRTSEKRAQAGGLQGGDDKKIKRPAILTGEGEREARIERTWWLVFAGAVLGVALLAFLFTRSGERSQAVQAFTAELPAGDNRYGRRIPAIQARAWNPDVTPFISLPAPRIGSAQEIPAATLDEALGKLAGMTYVPTAGRWIAKAKADWLAKQPGGDPNVLAQRLEKAGVVTVSQQAVVQALKAANLSDTAVEIVTQLLLIEGPLAGRLAAGPAPTIAWCQVSGREGVWLANPGQGYQTRTSGYDGLLVAFPGSDWPPGWKFLRLAPTGTGKP